jgi:hypothetical protein
MGEWKRPVLYSVGLAGAIAAAALPWWTVGGGAWTPKLDIGLTSWTMCHDSDCMKVPVMGGGLYAGVAWTTMLLAVFAAVGYLGAAFLSFIDSLPEWLPKRLAAIAGALMGSGALTWFALDPPPGVHPSPTWGLLGCAVAVLAGIVGGALHLTVEHVETETLATARVVAMPPSSEPRKVLAGTVDLQRAVDAATRPAKSGVAARGSSKAAVDAMRETLRFVVDTGAFDAHGLRVRTTDGDERTIRWIDLDRAVARRLPPDPPFEKTLLVDLVPKEGPPLRLLQSTRLEWRNLPGGAATTARENLRRLVAHAQACHPALVIDPASEAFVLRGAEPPQLGSARLVAEYDAAYG